MDAVRCVIFAGAPISDDRYVKDLIRKDDFIICADSGMRHAKRLNITPNVIVGDFDSYHGPLPQNVFSITLPTEKDDTDTYHAMQVGMDRGCRDFLLFGAVGGRLDHTLANIGTLNQIVMAGCTGALLDYSCDVRMVRNGSLCVQADGRKYLSVFAYGGPAEGVTLKGLKYPLRDYTLTPNFPIGVSNEITAETANISVKNGTLMIIYN